MEIYYRDVDITNLVQPRECLISDYATDRADSINLLFDNSDMWFAWRSESDDWISVTDSGYDSGKMYVNDIIPENGKYRIIATSLSCKARNKGYKSYLNMTLNEILNQCSMESGMEYETYGVENVLIPYAEKDNECNASFLKNLLKSEGVFLKIYGGRYIAIDVRWAQNRDPVQTIEILDHNPGYRYTRSGKVYQSLVISSPYANGIASDISVVNGINLYENMYVRDNVQANRFAVSKLLLMNRESETLHLNMDFNHQMTAALRIDVSGNTDAEGKWLIDHVQHDLLEMKTTAMMHRCIYTIE